MSRILSLATKLHFLFLEPTLPRPLYTPDSMALRQLVRVQKELRSLLTVKTPYQIGRVFPVWQLHLRCLCLQREVKNYAGAYEWNNNMLQLIN